MSEHSPRPSPPHSRVMKKRVRPTSYGYRASAFIGATLGGLAFFFSAIFELWWFLYISPVSLFLGTGEGEALFMMFLVGAGYGAFIGLLVRSLTLRNSKP